MQASHRHNFQFLSIRRRRMLLVVVGIILTVSCFLTLRYYGPLNQSNPSLLRVGQPLQVANAESTSIIKTLLSAKQTTESPMDRRIPTIIHQTWRDANVPVDFLPWMRSWKINHPTWRYVLWTDELMRKMIAERFPAYLNTYDGYDQAIERADAFRYFVLYEFGGIYADLDMESLNPLDERVLSKDCISSQEPEAHSYIHYNLERPLPCNAFMMCRPRHPFFKYTIDNLERFRSKNGTRLWVLVTTGPLFMYKILGEYQNLQKGKTDPLLIGAQDDFMPTYDNFLTQILFAKCSKGNLTSLAMHTCKTIQAMNYSNKAPSSSYCTHHWVHSYVYDTYGVKNPKKIRYVYIKEKIPDICLGWADKHCF